MVTPAADVQLRVLVLGDGRSGPARRQGVRQCDGDLGVVEGLGLRQLLVRGADVLLHERRGGRGLVDGRDALVRRTGGLVGRLVVGADLVGEGLPGRGRRVGVRDGRCRGEPRPAAAPLEPPVDAVSGEVHLLVLGPGELGLACGAVVRDRSPRRGERLDLVDGRRGAGRVAELDARGAGPVDVVDAEGVFALRDREVDGLLHRRRHVLPQVDLACAVDVHPYAVQGRGVERERAAGAEVTAHGPADAEVVARQAGGRSAGPRLIGRRW
jgi:hypothetical protein